MTWIEVEKNQTKADDPYELIEYAQMAEGHFLIKCTLRSPVGTLLSSSITYSPVAPPVQDGSPE